MGPVKLLVRALRSRWVMALCAFVVALFAFSMFATLSAMPGARSLVNIYRGDLHIHRFENSHEETLYAAYRSDIGEDAVIQWNGLENLLPRLSNTSGERESLIIPLSWPAVLASAWWFYLLGHRRGRRIANPDACRRCGYPLGAGEGQRTCPECGTRKEPARATTLHLL